ncbi:MAG: sulfate permease [Pseudomonadota bacterium]
MDWVGELKDNRVLRGDVLSGITVALVLVPQSMAYAQLAGLDYHYGLYASFIPGIIAALFGSSRQLSTGPVAVVSLMTASTLGPIASDPETYIAWAVLLAFLVGLFQLTLGLLRMGVLVNFLSHPVVIGFTNAAAIIIATSQLGKLFGVSVGHFDQHYETVWHIVLAALSGTHFYTLVMGITSLAVMVVIRQWKPAWPNVLIAVFSATLASWSLGFENAGGAVVGRIPEGLPNLKAPAFDVSTMLNLMSAAVIISLVGFMEAISISKAIAARTRQKLDPNRELIGQGLSNFASSFFQGYPVSGSFSRSAVNMNAGALTGFSAVVTGLVVGLTLLVLTPALYHLPQATLAAVIIMAVINLVRVAPMLYAWRVQRHDGIVAFVVFGLTLILAPHLEWGIVTGMMLSLSLYLYRTMKPRVVQLSRHFDGSLRDAELYGLRTCDSISLIRFDGNLYFANTGYFEEKVLESAASKPNLQYIIIDAEGINEIDATGEEMLHGLASRLKSAGVELLFARTKKQVQDILHRTRFVELLGEEHFARLRRNAVDLARERMGCESKSCPLYAAIERNENPETPLCPVLRVEHQSDTLSTR